MLSTCVLCGGGDTRVVLDVARAPRHHFRSAAAKTSEAHFGALRIVRCSNCGHLYNRGFDSKRVDDLYQAEVLTNTPVSDGMRQALKDVSHGILDRARARPTILEVGGGSGDLALILSERSAEVHLVEPSQAVNPQRFAGSRVVLHRSMFPAASVGQRQFDIVICRQVLEHIPDPARFLSALRERLDPAGLAYIELPSADYIVEHASIVDFHYLHVHYYSRAAVEALLARAGFSVQEVVAVKDGHDMGFFLRSAQPKQASALEAHDSAGFERALEARRAKGHENLLKLGGPLVLYGANPYSQALFGLYPDIASYSCMFDDTPLYAGHRAYAPACDIPIGAPRADQLREARAVIITAYLHDKPIAQKLRNLGYRGAIYTVRADRRAGRTAVPPSLFSAL